MKIIEFGYRNFNSYGSEWVKFNFVDTETSLNLISGLNGTGKSTVLEALGFSIYGKVKNKNIPNLPNRLNQNLETFVVILNSNNELLKIERGISPNYLNFYVNNSLYDMAGKRNLQKIIEKNYLGITFEVFDNIISLSVNKFKSFLHMNKNDKKYIIDKICNTTHFNNMLNINKDNIKDIKKELQTLEAKILTYSDEVKIMDKSITQLLNNNNNNNLTTLKESLIIKNNSYKENNITLMELKNISNLYEKIISDFTIKSKADKTILDLYKKGICSKCKTVHKVDLKELEILKESFKKLSKELKKAKTENIEVLSSQKKLINKNDELQKEILDLEKTIKSIQSNKKIKLDLLETKINEFNQKIEDIEKIKFESEITLNEHLILNDLLSEKGLKHLVMRNLSPLITNESNKVLQILGLKYSILWNEYSEITLFENYKEIENSTLSTGETKKIDFAILISLIKILKINYPQINILFIDEIFASIDINAINPLISIVNNLIKSLNINCFIIHHSSLQLSEFDNIYNTSKNIYSEIKNIS